MCGGLHDITLVTNFIEIGQEILELQVSENRGLPLTCWSPLQRSSSTVLTVMRRVIISDCSKPRHTQQTLAQLQLIRIMTVTSYLRHT